MTETQSSSPTVSVIIPTYNRAHLVGRAIRSVLAQTFQDFELIVVDDGSTDNTEEVVREFADPRIIFLRHETNRGPSAARNTGIRESRGEYIAFLDSDDEWLPEKLEKQLEVFLQSGSEVGVVGCGRLDHTRQGFKPTLPTISGWLFWDLLADRARGLGTQLLLVRRASSSPEVLFDETFPCFEERDYLLRISREHTVAFVNEPLVRVYHDKTEKHVANPAAAVEGYRLLMRKYASEIDQIPDLLGYYLYRVARELISVGRIGEARRELVQAIRQLPLRPGLYLLFLATWLGRPGAWLARRVVNIQPPRGRQHQKP